MATLKQSNIWARKFLMVLSSDHVTGATGKTVGIKISKGSGAGGTNPTGSGGGITELDSTNMPGWYQYKMTIEDTNTQGDLAIVATASGCDPTVFIDQVQTTVFSDMLLVNGRAGINLPLIEKAPFAGFDFLMTNAATGAPLTGATVASQVSISGAAFVAGHNTPTELSNGIYTNAYVGTGTTGELGGTMIMARYTAPGANDLDIGIIPTP